MLHVYVFRDFANKAIVYVIETIANQLSNIDTTIRHNIIHGATRLNNEKTSNTLEHLLLYSEHTNANTIIYYINAIGKSKSSVCRFADKFANSKFYFLSNDNIMVITKQFEKIDAELVLPIQEGLIDRCQFTAVCLLLREVKSCDKKAAFVSYCNRAKGNQYMTQALEAFVKEFPEFQRLMMLY